MNHIYDEQDWSETVGDHALLRLSAARAASALAAAPQLMSHIRHQVAPSIVRASDGMPRAASKEPPASARVDPIDDADAVYAQLVDWLVSWCDTFAARPPAVARQVRSSRDGVVQGFRGSMDAATAAGLTRAVCVNLSVMEADILRHPHARVYFDDIAAIIHQASARYPQAPGPRRTVIPRACDACFEDAVGAHWGSSDLLDVVVRCQNCEKRYSPTDALRTLGWLGPETVVEPLGPGVWRWACATCRADGLGSQPAAEAIARGHRCEIAQ
ncbi:MULTISPECIES: hypothetical protein [Clavibacter]|uniref:Uncharacterized protein n=2 Tax=Clavibacter TaxID=1573 RepID=A0A399NXX0_9MICO|nr:MULTISPECIES: hypothetical protein [Clavibacter]KDP90895.1 hypothetical protein W824_09455 [Clavibacter cf. michiganensis LMG 26808]RII98990.1 hypothetical protein DZF96_00640 [Clavibacter michiganensis]UKF24629.1 hypothetical protein KYT88_13020 [Clavibacter sp. A6099]